MRTRIKFCGLTQPADVATAVQLGVDALGFVFHPKSPRYVTAQQARALTEGLPPFISRVALFMNAQEPQIREVMAVWTPSYLQFHGQESPEFCARFGLPFLKAIAMQSDVDLCAMHSRYAAATALLLDGHAPGEAGGSGQRFDWQRAQSGSRPIILAGGLTVQNVSQAIAAVKPFAVDVSSGIETAPGHKDAVKMADFVAAVRAADTALAMH